MSKLVWDQTGERFYETGVDHGVVYPQVSGAYPKGEAWNGLISVTKSPSGAEPTALWANNHKYANLLSAEELSFTIEAYMYPDSFAACNGEAELTKGVRMGQQKRTPFGMVYRNWVGNDAEGTKAAYILNIIYGAFAAPAEEADTTINDSPEAKTMSWECSTTPVEVDGFEPTASLEIDSRTVDSAKLAKLEEVLFGGTEKEAHLPLPAEIATIIGTEG